ncbi:MAG: hypothetical protein PWQ55_2084 [Chloroflexota bacterium]|nr:hypothetical protein [Chloroflexota bacterium]
MEIAVLREKLLALFPSDGPINEHLTIEKNENSPEGFSAVWQMYIKEKDEENSRKFYNFSMTHSILVDIHPEDTSVHIKITNKKKSAKPPEGETVYYPWYRQVKVGKMDDLKAQFEAESKKNSFSYSTKKLKEPLINCIVNNGWDAVS